MLVNPGMDKTGPVPSRAVDAVPYEQLAPKQGQAPAPPPTYQMVPMVQQPPAAPPNPNPGINAPAVGPAGGSSK